MTLQATLISQERQIEGESSWPEKKKSLGDNSGIFILFFSLLFEI